MRTFLSVFKYTFKENIIKKSFIISSVITIVLITLLMIIPGLISKNDDNSYAPPEETISGGTVFIYDVTGDNKEVLKAFSERIAGYKTQFVKEEEIEALKEEIKNSDNKSLMLIKKENGSLSFEYIVKGAMNGANPDYLKDILEYANRITILKEAGLSNDIANRMTADVSYSLNELSGGAVGTVVVSIIILLLIFFAIYFYGYGVSMSVASEKTSRVMELLITSAKPATIVLGKSSAMGVLGLIQFAAILLFGAISYFLFFPKDFSLGGMSLNFSMLTPFVIIMLIIYFILGYSLSAMLQAVTGASVSKAEDLTSAMMPVSFLSILSFYLGYASLASPSSAYAAIVSIIPFSAPYAMPLRLISGNVPLWHIILSISLMLITIAFVSFVSIKIYSNAVLHYGSKLSVLKLLKSK